MMRHSIAFLCRSSPHWMASASGKSNGPISKFFEDHPFRFRLAADQLAKILDVQSASKSVSYFYGTCVLGSFVSLIHDDFKTTDPVDVLTVFRVLRYRGSDLTAQINREALLNLLFDNHEGQNVTVVRLLRFALRLLPGSAFAARRRFASEAALQVCYSPREVDVARGVRSDDEFHARPPPRLPEPFQFRLLLFVLSCD
jgi:hypothetical protein